MNWVGLSLKEWRRRPLRTGITVAGVTLAVAALFSLLAFHEGYQEGVRSELDRLGAHVLVVPKGCPYDAASMALHGASWPCYLTTNQFEEIRTIAGVSHAAPAFMGAVAASNGTSTVYLGIDERMLALRSGWKIHGAFPQESGDILAGSEAARSRGWKIGDRVPLPELPGETGVIRGVLQTTRGSEDGFLFTRLADAQRWFHKPGQLTHVLVRLQQADVPDSTLAAMRGCDAGMDMNIVPLTHLFRTIQTLVTGTRLLLGCIAILGLLIAGAGVSNAMLMSVTERSREIGVLRAIGASRTDVFRLIWLETIQLCAAGGIAGVALAWMGARLVESWLRGRLPFAPSDALIRWDWTIAGACLAGAVLLGSLAAWLPAARAAELTPMEAIREGAHP